MPRKKRKAQIVVAGDAARSVKEIKIQDILPAEIILSILSHLRGCDLYSCMLVSMEWFIYATDNSIWYPVYQSLQLGGTVNYREKSDEKETSYFEAVGLSIMVVEPVSDPDSFEWGRGAGLGLPSIGICEKIFVAHGNMLYHRHIHNWPDKSLLLEDLSFFWIKDKAGGDIYVQSKRRGVLLGRYPLSVHGQMSALHSFKPSDSFFTSKDILRGTAAFVKKVEKEDTYYGFVGGFDSTGYKVSEAVYLKAWTQLLYRPFGPRRVSVGLAKEAPGFVEE